MENFVDLPQQVVSKIINKSSDAIFVSDKNGKFVLVNQTACDSVGYTKKELLKLTISDINPNFDLKDIDNLIDLIKRKEFYLLKSLHLKKDGSKFPVEVNISMLNFDTDEYLLGFAKDISKRHTSNESIEYLGDDYDVILDTTLDGYLVINLQGDIIEVNKVYCELIGYTKDELLNMSVSDLEVIESVEDTKAHLEKIITNKTDIFETKHRKKDGEIVILEVSITYVSGCVEKFISFIRDITKRKKLLQELQDSKENLNEAQQLSNIGHWEFDLTKNSIRWSDEVFRIFDLKPQEFKPTYETFLSYLHPDDLDMVNNSYLESVKEKKDYQIVHRIITSSNTVKYVEDRCKHRYGENGEVVYSIGTIHDITQRIHHENELQIASNVFHYTKEGIVITDEKNKIVTINKAYESLSGYTIDDVKGYNPRKFSSGWGNKEFYKKMWDDIINKGHWRGEITDRSKHGNLYIVDVNIVVVKDSNENILNYIAISRDITEFKAQHDKIRQIAFYDFLTQLPNRRLFEERIKSHIDTAKYYNKKFALLFMDLDNFKWINDSLGHNIGDKVLIYVSQLIQELLPTGATFSRLGGDEFVILKPYTDIQKVSLLASKIIDTVNKPIQIDGHEMSVGWSIGVSLFPENGKYYEELLKNADVAMYKAKENGKNNFEFFNVDMNLEVKKRLEVDNRLRSATKNNRFTLNYQPKCECPSKKLVGFEALIRWNDPILGSVPPDEFIPIAEQLGYIYEIGLWVLNQALKDLVEFHKQNKNLNMAINVSVKQLEYSTFIDDVKMVISKYDIPSDKIEFEITETAVMENIDTILPILNEIKSMGIRLSIDDFGTGYSSLMYLKKMPINILKIDKEFVDSIDQDKDDKAIVEATIAMAKALNLKTVAEGVEKEEHLCILSKIGCDSFQGYYFSKPLPFINIKNMISLN